MALEIKQGTNSPIIIVYPDDVSDSTDLHVGLYDARGNELIHWTKETLVINGNEVRCPLEQYQTMDLPPGAVCLESKRRTADGEVELYDKYKGVILGRYDHHELAEEK